MLDHYTLSNVTLSPRVFDHLLGVGTLSPWVLDRYTLCNAKLIGELFNHIYAVMARVLGCLVNTLSVIR